MIIMKRKFIFSEAGESLSYLLNFFFLSFSILMVAVDCGLYDDLPLFALISDVSISDFILLFFLNAKSGVKGPMYICLLLLLLVVTYYTTLLISGEHRPRLLSWKPFFQFLSCVIAIGLYFRSIVLRSLPAEIHCRNMGIITVLVLCTLALYFHFLSAPVGNIALSVILVVLMVSGVFYFMRNIGGYYPLFSDSAFFKDLAEEAKAKAESTSVTDGKMQALFASVEGYMVTNKPYLNENFDLSDLSLSIYSNKTYLSKTINCVSGMNFRQYVNRYRVRNAMSMMIEDPHLRMAEVSYLSGFHNQVTFNMAFKLVTEQTPGDWYKDYKASQKMARKKSHAMALDEAEV